jgi:hypothetical protein
MKRWLLAILFACVSVAAHALPTVADVEAEVRKGNYGQAESMMGEVLAAKPSSARAHYVYAELLAHNKKLADASREVARAKQIDPSLKFTDAAKFTAFEQLLARNTQNAAATAVTSPPLDNLGPGTTAGSTVPAAPNQRAPAREIESRAPAAAGGMPSWIWVVGLAGIGFVIWRMMNRSRATASAPVGAGFTPGSTGAATAGYGPGAGYPPGYGQSPGYGPAGGVARPGGGMMGVGLAAAGGVAAGMLAEKYLEHGREQSQGHPTSLDNGGATPASFDADARNLENRSVDFGSGNGWDAGGDAGNVDAGSASDGGGGSDGDGGW